MASTGILCDLQDGHLIPALGLGESLKNAGHEVTFLVIEDMEAQVKSAGFNYEIILNKDYPMGAKQRMHEMNMEQSEKLLKTHLVSLVEGALDSVFERLNLDVLLTSYFLSAEALIIHYKYQIQQVFFCTYLRQQQETLEAECMEIFMGLEGETAAVLLDFFVRESQSENIGGLSDLVAPLSTYHELMLCPKEFDFPEKAINWEKMVYMGPCLGRVDIHEPKMDLPENRKIIYTSFGSQTSIYLKDYLNLIRKLIEIFSSSEFSTYHLIIATGPFIDHSIFDPLPPNVELLEWAPQKEIISKSDLTISHGGLGSIKESLFYGVPLLVFPMVNDQPDNALRVERHQLGRKLSMNISVEQLKQAIVGVLHDKEIQKNTKKMSVVFQEREQQNIGGQLIDKLVLTNS